MPYEGTLDGKTVADLLPEKPMYGKQTNTWEEAGNQTGMGVDAIAEGVIECPWKKERGHCRIPQRF